VKVLVVGGGAREHAIAWKVRQSPLVQQLYAAPGNPGIAKVATCFPVDAANVVELADLAERLRIDLTIVGPELPLTLGIVETFEKRGLAAFGASSRAVTIESSKVFAKEFMARHGIPTAASEVFDAPEAARIHLESEDARYPLVVKADGLAGGKGVVICADRRQASEAVLQMMEDRIHGNAGDRIVVEEFLEGREASYFAISDGERFAPLVTCQDYKRVFDGDVGPNTGGMGAYSPSAYVDDALSAQIRDRIVAPTIAGLAAEGRTYKGVLYAGVMLTAEGPKVLEFNARFGDPETQVLMPRAAFDIVPLMASAAAGRLDDAAIAWKSESAATVVLASAGIPARTRGEWRSRVWRRRKRWATSSSSRPARAATATARPASPAAACCPSPRWAAIWPPPSRAPTRPRPACDSRACTIAPTSDATPSSDWRPPLSPHPERSTPDAHLIPEKTPVPKPLVAILMGSDSDLPIMAETVRVLNSFDVPHEILVSSAHRSPERTARYVKSAPGRGVRVFIAGAGGAAHLAGAVAAMTTLPVIGVPLPGSDLNGLDALLATVMMPPGVPVATVAVGKMGARNAGAPRGLDPRALRSPSRARAARPQEDDGRGSGREVEEAAAALDKLLAPK
jgi:phosphoribosylamine--glycine ligase